MAFVLLIVCGALLLFFVSLALYVASLEVYPAWPAVLKKDVLKAVWFVFCLALVFFAAEGLSNHVDFFYAFLLLPLVGFSALVRQVWGQLRGNEKVGPLLICGGLWVIWLIIIGYSWTDRLQDEQYVRRLATDKLVSDPCELGVPGVQKLAQETKVRVLRFFNNEIVREYGSAKDANYWTSQANWFLAAMAKLANLALVTAENPMFASCSWNQTKMDPEEIRKDVERARSLKR